MDTIQELLSSWNKLVVIGANPEKHDSILTMCGDTKVSIEFMYDTSDSTGCTYTIALLIGYTSEGRRFTIQSWGCHDDDTVIFHKWFKHKMYEARGLDYDNDDALKTQILNQLKD